MSIFTGARSFNTKLSNFAEETYTLGENTHLYKLMHVLLEDAGVGSLRKLQTLAQMTATIDGVRFSDLDLIFGEIFNFARFPEEMYHFDPWSQPLTTDEWDEVHRKDAQYRERIKMFMQSLMRGGTNEGIAMAAEAASGYPCQVLELWRASADLGLPGTAGRVPKPAGAALSNPKEFIIVPELSGTTAIPPARQRAILQVVNRLKPANTVASMNSTGLEFHSIVTIQEALSDSEYFEIRKYVTGVNVPPAPPGERFFWIKDGVEVEVPTYANLKTQEERWNLNKNVQGVATFKLAFEATEYEAVPQPIQNEQQSYGPWREVELADSPDNYPEGKYPSDPNKYSGTRYVWAWSSQAHYLAWLDGVLANTGGERIETSYRLPQSLPVTAGTTTTPNAALAPPRISVSSPWNRWRSR